MNREVDIKEYIASGVVELYAMNALPSNEKKEFERYLLLYPDLSEELRNVSGALERFSEDQSINPSPKLRIQIVEAFANGKENIPVEKIERPADKISSLITYKYLIAASLAALVISTFASWFFYSRWEDAENRYTDLLNDKNELATSYNVVKATYDDNLTKMFVMRDPITKMFELRSNDNLNRSIARVYWNTETHRTYIDMLTVPDPDDGMQFQLWAVHSGNPVDAGICSADNQGLQQVRDVDSVSYWVLSLENKNVIASAPTSAFLSSQ